MLRNHGDLAHFENRNPRCKSTYTHLPKVFVHPKLFHANNYKMSIFIGSIDPINIIILELFAWKSLGCTNTFGR